MYLLRGGLLHLASQIGNDQPLQFSSWLVIELRSKELWVRVSKKLRELTQVPLQDEFPSVAKLVELDVLDFHL